MTRSARRCSATSPPGWSRSSTQSPDRCCARRSATASRARRSSGSPGQWPRRRDNRRVLEAVFWVAVGLIVYTHAGYPLLLWLVSRLRPPPPADRHTTRHPPPGSLIVAAPAEAGGTPRQGEKP